MADDDEHNEVCRALKSSDCTLTVPRHAWVLGRAQPRMLPTSQADTLRQGAWLSSTHQATYGKGPAFRVAAHNGAMNGGPKCVESGGRIGKVYVPKGHARLKKVVSEGEGEDWE